MRIGIEAQRIFRSKKHGMDIYALELIRALQRSDRENEYFIFVKPDADRCLEESQNFTIVEVRGITYADWEQVRLPLAAGRYNLDVLHCTSNTAPVFSPVPTVLTLHDIIYLNKAFSGGSLYQRLGHYYRKWVVPLAFKKARQVFTVSDFEKDCITAALGYNYKLKTVYNAVDSKFRPLTKSEKDVVKSQYNLPDQYLFFLGNTVPKKNMKGMLYAYTKYHDEAASPLPLVIAESTAQELQTVLRSIDRADLQDMIQLTGYVPHNELPGIYAAATLFIYPSLRESFGIPIIEAMACGTPVIASNTSSMPEVAGGAAYLINPYNAEEIAQAMLWTLEETSYRKKLSIEGLSRAAQFTWKHTAEEVKVSYLDEVTSIN